MKLNIFAILFLNIIISSASFAQEGNFGFPGMIYYFVSNARSFGLARADVTINGDVKTLLSNPSGLGGVEIPQVSFCHSKLLLDSDYYSLFFASRAKVFGSNVVLGGGLIHLDNGEFEQRDSENRYLGNFGLAENALIFSVGKTNSLSNSFALNLGANFKVYNQSFTGLQKQEYWNTRLSNYSYSFDFGALLEYQKYEHIYIKLGLSLSNINLANTNAFYELPVMYKAGIELSYEEKPFKIKNPKARFIYNCWQIPYYHGKFVNSFAGEIEHRFLSHFSIKGRLGYNSEDKRSFLFLGFGCVFLQIITRLNLHLDYSFVIKKSDNNYDGLEFPDHLISIGFEYKTQKGKK